MSLRVQEATYDDMPAMIDCIYEVYSNPYHPYIDIVFPGSGTNAKEGREAVVQRQIESWKKSPHTKWIMAIDDKTGQIAGYTHFQTWVLPSSFQILHYLVDSCEADNAFSEPTRVTEWDIFSEPPFPNGPPHLEATWQPEGSLIREYLTFIMNDRLERQAKRCPMPNVWLQTMGVRPSYRRRGAASLMMDWGVARADEMDIPIFVEASYYGSQVYRKYDFYYVDEFRGARPKEREGDPGWDEMERKHYLEAEWWERKSKTAREKEGVGKSSEGWLDRKHPMEEQWWEKVGRK